MSILALLNAAFALHTVDLSITMQRIHSNLGYTDAVLQWFSSHLTDCTHHVSLSNRCSAFVSVHLGIPQGTVTCYILLSMHIKPLSAIIETQSITHHSFADDLQLLISAPLNKISGLLLAMQT